MATRQTSSSGRPKSPRIQVVLPEELCERLSLLADSESRTVSNMAKVLIQQGVERLERQRLAPEPPPAAGPTPARGTEPAIPAAPSAPDLRPRASTRGESDPSGADPAASSATDRFRSELERRSSGPTARLRGLPPRLRFRPPGRG